MKVKDFRYYSGKKYDGMMGRCYRENDISYKNYGAKQIRVCSAWIKDIEIFRTWMLSQISSIGITEEEFVLNSKKYQLDRIDTHGNYTPENCKLSSPQENSRNKAKTMKKVISAEGEEITFNSY